MVDMKLTPLQMVIAEVNKANSLNIQISDVQPRGPQVLGGAVEETVTVDGQQYQITRNTQLDIDLLSDEVKDNFVSIKYQRIDLGKLFSLCNPSLFELDIKEGNVATGAYSNAQIIAKVLEKYEVAVDETDFIVTADHTNRKITIAAKETNVAYIGTVDITIDMSLVTRVATTELAGFIKQ